jgi:hypothetical protein
MGELAMNSINIVGAIASILGLVVTLFVFSRVKKIAKSFSTQALLPTYTKKLGGAINNLKEYQKSKNGPQIRVVLSVSEVTLEDLVEHLDDKRAERVKQALLVVRKSREIQSDDDLWEQSGLVIAGLEGVRATIVNLKNEMQWRGRDA